MTSKLDLSSLPYGYGTALFGTEPNAQKSATHDKKSDDSKLVAVAKQLTKSELFIAAAEKGDLDPIKTLEKDVGEDEINRGLALAAAKGQALCVKYFLDGRKIAKSGIESALQYAYTYGTPETFALLDQATNKTVSAQSDQKSMSSSSSSMALKIKAALITPTNEQENILKAYEAGKKPLLDGEALCEVVEVDDVDKLKQLLATAKQKGVYNATLKAAKSGKFKCLELLIKTIKGEDETEKRIFRCCLSDSSAEGHKECVKLLSEKLKDDKETIDFALQLAGEKGKVECVKILVPLATTAGKENTIKCASLYRQTVTVKILKEQVSRPAIESALRNAAAEGDVACVRELCPKPGEWSNTCKALHWAVHWAVKHQRAALMTAASLPHDCVDILLPVASADEIEEVLNLFKAVYPSSMDTTTIKNKLEKALGLKKPNLRNEMSLKLFADNKDFKVPALKK